MRLYNSSDRCSVYAVQGEDSGAAQIPEWIAKKRKRSLKYDPQFAQSLDLLQSFEFPEASQCVRVSEDGDWVMATGTYKSQIRVWETSQLAMSFERHTDDLNKSFVLLSSDYSKSLHLQADRGLDIQGKGGLHYSTRIPRYGRDVLYDRASAEALIPAVGKEIFRLDLQVGRFLKPYEVEVEGGDDRDHSINTGSIAEQTHGLFAAGLSSGTIQFFDPRARSRVGILSPGKTSEGEITALQYHSNGLELAVGNSSGVVKIFDLRSPRPLLEKEQGYGLPIRKVVFLETSNVENQILTADKKIIKIWDRRSGDQFTSIEPSKDMNDVEVVPRSGYILTAQESSRMGIWHVPQIGTSPSWASFMDSMVEEMAEDENDPNAFNKSTGDVYEGYKFLTKDQISALNLDHIVSNGSNLARPYMHGYFISQKLYEEAKLIANPDAYVEARQKSIQQKIAKERESRVRGHKKAQVAVNRKLAEKILEREEKAERRRARKLLERSGDEDGMVDAEVAPAVGEVEGQEPEGEAKEAKGVLHDPRFTRLFEDEDFEVDEQSHEFQAINPSTKIPKGLTAVEEEEAQELRGSDESSSESETEQIRPMRKEAASDNNRISTSSYKKSGKKSQGPQMVVSSSTRRAEPRRDRSFGARVSKLQERKAVGNGKTTVVGEREISFMPEKKSKKKGQEDGGQRHDRKKDRRSASNNVFRGL